MLDSNLEKNKEHYEEIYSRHSINNTLSWLGNLEVFLDTNISTETSWHGLYANNFRDQLKGKKVLEMGCGDCTNAAVMAALGAEVYANDIAPASGEIVKKLNDNFDFEYEIRFLAGNFLDNKLAAESFDFVIGKAFLHHLEIPLERLFLKETARLLKPDGEARFFEPAVNSRFIDDIRWFIPVKGRPSKINRKKFLEWKQKDPHPDRSFSSKHWEEVGYLFFKSVKIIPIGAIERFSRLMNRGKKRQEFRRKAFRIEKILPQKLNRYLARSQTIIYTQPFIED